MGKDADAQPIEDADAINDIVGFDFAEDAESSSEPTGVDGEAQPDEADEEGSEASPGALQRRRKRNSSRLVTGSMTVGKTQNRLFDPLWDSSRQPRISGSKTLS
jgi:hypothetical protein